MTSVDFPVKLRRATFHRITLLSPTFVPHEPYGTPDTRRLGLAVASNSIEGRPYEDVDMQYAQALAGAVGAAQASQSYSFPILS